MVSPPLQAEHRGSFSKAFQASLTKRNKAMCPRSPSRSPMARRKMAGTHDAGSAGRAAPSDPRCMQQSQCCRAWSGAPFGLSRLMFNPKPMQKTHATPSCSGPRAAISDCAVVGLPFARQAVEFANPKIEARFHSVIPTTENTLGGLNRRRTGVCRMTPVIIGILADS